MCLKSDQLEIMFSVLFLLGPYYYFAQSKYTNFAQPTENSYFAQDLSGMVSIPTSHRTYTCISSQRIGRMLRA